MLRCAAVPRARPLAGRVAAAPQRRSATQPRSAFLTRSRMSSDSQTVRRTCATCVSISERELCQTLPAACSLQFLQFCNSFAILASAFLLIDCLCLPLSVCRALASLHACIARTAARLRCCTFGPNALLQVASPGECPAAKASLETRAPAAAATTSLLTRRRRPSDA